MIPWNRSAENTAATTPSGLCFWPSNWCQRGHCCLGTGNVPPLLSGWDLHSLFPNITSSQFKAQETASLRPKLDVMTCRKEAGIQLSLSVSKRGGRICRLLGSIGQEMSRTDRDSKSWGPETLTDVPAHTHQYPQPEAGRHSSPSDTGDIKQNSDTESHLNDNNNTVPGIYKTPCE